MKKTSAVIGIVILLGLFFIASGISGALSESATKTFSVQKGGLLTVDVDP
jgi:hypothetical protein